MVTVDVRKANEDLKKLQRKLSSKHVAKATARALNESLAKGKTEMRKSISSLYNISAGRINSADPKKGLSVKKASADHPMAELKAGHLPIGLSETKVKVRGETIATAVSFKNGKAKKGAQIKRSKGKITVEVKKGQSKKLETAFTIGRGTNAYSGQQFTTPAIFARGRKGKPDFKFGKDRKPTDSLSTVSVATAALSTDAQAKVQPMVSAHVVGRIKHHLTRMIDGAK